MHRKHFRALFHLVIDIGFSSVRQLECAISEQRDILLNEQQQFVQHSSVQVEQSRAHREMVSSAKVLMRKVELRLKVIEVEMKESRRNYRKTMRSLEEMSEQMHHERVIAQVERKRTLLAANAAVSLLALHNRLLHCNAVLVQICSLGQAMPIDS